MSRGDNMKRNKGVDAYMEARFCKPDYTRSFIDENGMVRTPMGNKWLLWRIDPP